MAADRLLLLRNGLVFDGSGATPQVGSVLIQGERIADTGPNIATPPDATIIECDGLAIAPGFIDIHSHSDLQVLANAPEKLQQGVTSEVVGNCGFSTFPSCHKRAEVHEHANSILHGGTDWAWKSSRDYLEDAAKLSRIANVYSLTGHGTLRVPTPVSDRAHLLPTKRTPWQAP